MQQNGEQTEEIDALNQLESSFYQSGYDAGYEHGRAHGTFDGRALGQEKGFELWEELGYYMGQAKFWQTIYANDAGKKRAFANVEQLLGLIEQFPAANDSTKQQGEQDIEALLQSIRSKYRVTCSSFGVRPRIQAAGLSM